MISCDKHDYVEIACMYRFPVTLHLKSGQQISGKAIDIDRDGGGRECIRLEIEGHDKRVALDEVSIMEAQLDNPHFSQVKLG